jgi:hypothetical protein
VTVGSGCCQIGAMGLEIGTGERTGSRKGSGRSMVQDRATWGQDSNSVNFTVKILKLLGLNYCYTTVNFDNPKLFNINYSQSIKTININGTAKVTHP